MNCKREGCFEVTSGKSSYCDAHKREARQAWVQMIKTKASENEVLHKQFHAAWQQAKAAGAQAVATCQVVPMVVEKHANMLDDTSPVEQSWYVPDGVCGFAWLVTKGGTKFANWAKKNAAWKQSSEGTTFWVSSYGQSMQKKEAWAEAAAKSLRDHGIEVSARSRID